MNWVLRGEMRVLGALRQERPWPVPRRMIPSAWWGDGGRRGQIAGVIQRWNLWERESVCCVLPGAGSDAVAGVDCRGQHGHCPQGPPDHWNTSAFALFLVGSIHTDVDTLFIYSFYSCVAFPALLPAFI